MLADTLVVAAGPWLPQLVGPDLARHFRICRQTLFWFDIDGPITPFLPENFPVFIWEAKGSTQGIYGFPAIDGAGGGLKIATEQFETTTTPEAVERAVGAEEISAMYDRYVAPHFRAVNGKCVRATSCLYTVTRDFGFVIDRHPDSDRVIVASPCSGHGFKHSAAIGEALAELATEGACSPRSHRLSDGRGFCANHDCILRALSFCSPSLPLPRRPYPPTTTTRRNARR